MTKRQSLPEAVMAFLVGRIGAAIYGSPSAIGEEAGRRIAEDVMVGIKKRTAPRHRMMGVHPWFRGEWLRRYIARRAR